MSKSKYIMKGELLNKKYEPFVEEFKRCDDDRLLVVNMLSQLLEACKAMESMDNVFVRVAFNRAFTEQNEMMESIVTRFTGRVWNGFMWLDGEVAE